MRAGLNKVKTRIRSRNRMSSPGSVSRRIADLKAGNQAAAGELCKRYFEDLVRLARKKLRGASRRVADEEDVVVDVLDSLCRAARRGRFPLLTDRDDLWRLLTVLTERKAANQVKRDAARKRGGGNVRGGSGFDRAGGASGEPGIQGVAGKAPCPATLGELKEQFASMLAALEDETLQKIAIWCMEGYTNQEIAARICRSLSSVDRKLKLIRDKWATRC
jgi:DNA-directed RNA polymerase specialized sigma24 family protein